MAMRTHAGDCIFNSLADPYAWLLYACFSLLKFVDFSAYSNRYGFQFIIMNSNV